jgi:hypothetical protein
MMQRSSSVTWGVGLFLLISGFSSTATSTQTILSRGLDSTNTDTTLEITKGLSTTANVLIANTPQVIISFVYLYYNNVLTCMLLAHEWSIMATNHQPLRVSRPRGKQRSTYYLQLPYRYILPLMAAMSCLHWLLARSIFLLQVKVFNNAGAEKPDGSIHVCSYSLFAIMIVLCVGAVMILTLVGLSRMRRLHGGIPVVGSCSAAISAACHLPDSDVREGDENLVAHAFLPLIYGVISSGRDTEGCQWQKPHAGFSSGLVMPLRDGVQY